MPLMLEAHSVKGEETQREKYRVKCKQTMSTFVYFISNECCNSNGTKHKFLAFLVSTSCFALISVHSHTHTQTVE